ncbi:hypothetical protein TNCV_1810311 [Trichonephila clavipes]|nr:hypothetical protein TNCV_1810311 [Trichonephila clavipes]
MCQNSIEARLLSIENDTVIRCGRKGNIRIVMRICNQGVHEGQTERYVGSERPSAIWKDKHVVRSVLYDRTATSRNLCQEMGSFFEDQQISCVPGDHCYSFP